LDPESPIVRGRIAGLVVLERQRGEKVLAFIQHIGEGLWVTAVMMISGLVLGLVSDRLLALVGLRDRDEGRS